MNIKSSYVISFMINLTVVFCIIQSSFYGNEHFIIKTIIGMIPFLYIIGIMVMSLMLVSLCFINYIHSNHTELFLSTVTDKEIVSINNLCNYFNNDYRKIYSNVENTFFIILFIITGHHLLCVLEIIIDIIIYFIGVNVNLLKNKLENING